MILDQISRSLRQFARDPGFTAAAVVTLALGIAANTCVFSVVYTALLRPLPYRHPDQLAVLWSSIPGKGIPQDWTSWPTIQDWREQSKSFEDVATELRIDSATLTRQEEPEQIKVGRVSANLFPLLAVQPVLGRTFTSEEEVRRDALVVISHQFWRAKFAASPSVIGQRIEVDHKMATVVGVMPQGFAFPSRDTQLWLPLSFVPQWSAFLAARQSDGFRAIARLKPGVSLEQAQSEMDVIAQRLEKRYPDTDAGKGIVLVPLAKQLTSSFVRSALWMTFGAAVLVLLIGCSNVASLLLARGALRSREFAVRTALGASRLRLIQQLTTESLVLAAVSSSLGVGVAVSLLPRVLPRIVPSDLAPYAHGGFSLPVLGFALALSVITAMFFGFVPAFQLSFAEPRNALKGDSRTQAGQRSHSRLRSALIVTEFAVAVILLSGTGLLMRSFLLLQQENLGFAPANLLLATIHLPLQESGRTRSTNVFFENALEQIKSVPGVANAAASGAVFSNYTPNTDVITEESALSSRSVQTEPSTLAIVSETFFETMRIPLLRGRAFSKDDGPAHRAVAVINKGMADQFWPGQNPIGKRFRYGSPGAFEPDWLTVIGVVGDMNPYGPGSKPIATLYRPYRQAPWPPTMDIVVRCNTINCASLGNDLRRAIRSVNREVPRFTVQTVPDILAQMSAPRRFQIWMLGLFSGIALCLATVGIYGLLSYLVSQRTQELGLRMALGATAQDVLRLILGSGLKLAGIGILAGLGASFFLMRLIRHLLFGVSTIDPVTILLVAATLLTTTVAASYFPARRAAQLDPLVSIRHE